MSPHNVCFYGELEKISKNYHQILSLSTPCTVYVFVENNMSLNSLLILRFVMNCYNVR